MIFQIKWWGPSRLLDKWSESRTHVYFDVTDSVKLHEDQDGKLWRLPYETVVPVEDRVLWRLLEFDVADRTGYIAPVQAHYLDLSKVLRRVLPLPLFWGFMAGLSGA